MVQQVGLEMKDCKFLILSLLLVLQILFACDKVVCAATTTPPAAGATDTVEEVANESLIQQIAEQEGNLSDATVGAELSDGLANGTGEWPTPPTTDPDDTVKWLIQAPGEAVKTMLPGAVAFLVDFLRDFVLNPNIAIDGVGQTDNGLGQLVAAIAPSIKQISQIMYAISIDLILLLFILAIWRYWIEGAWRGGGNHFAPIARLIWTAGLILAWPTIYAFEVELTNEMIHVIFFKSAAELAQLGNAISTVLAGIISALVGLALMAIAPLVATLATLPLGAILGPAIGGFIGFVGGLLFLIPGTVIILELVALVVLKSVQTAILIAQYMFAPVFLVFFASPDTEYIPKTFVKSFIEVSMWTFVWVGLLRILVIVMNSNTSIWAEFLLVIGILQLMLSAPEFLGRAHISPVSELLTAGLLIRGLQRSAQGMGMALNDGFKAFATLGKQGEIGGQRSVSASTTANDALVQGKNIDTTPPTVQTPTGPTPPLNSQTTATGGPPDPNQTQTGGPPLNAASPTNTTQTQTPTGPRLNSANTTGSDPPLRPGQGAVAAGGEQVKALLHEEGAVSAQDARLANMQQENVLGRSMFGAMMRKFGQKQLYGGGVRFGVSKDKNGLEFERNPITGDLTNVNLPEIDKEDRDENGKVSFDSRKNQVHAQGRALAAMIDHTQDSAPGREAARDAAIRKGALKPRTMSDFALAATEKSAGRRFEDTPLAKQRLAQAEFEESLAGAQAYLAGEKGNEVTDYWRRTHGDNGFQNAGEAAKFRQQKAREIAREADPTNPDSGLNPDQRRLSGFLDTNGRMSNNLTRAVSANPFIPHMPRGLQVAAFEGLYGAMQGGVQPAVEDELGGKLDYEDAVDLWQRVAPNVGRSKVMAMAMMRSVGMETSDLQMVNDVAQIGESLGGGIPNYTSAVGIATGLASKMSSLRGNLGPQGVKSVGDLVVKCDGMGLDMTDAYTQQAVIAEVENNRPINSARVRQIVSVKQATHSGTMTGNYRSDVADIVMGNPTVEGLSGREQSFALDGMSKYLDAHFEKGSAWANAARTMPEQVVRSIIALRSAGLDPAKAPLVQEVAVIATAEGGRPNSYQNAVRIVNSGTATLSEINARGSAAQLPDVNQLMRELNHQRVDISNPDIHKVVAQTVVKQPDVLTQPATREVVVKSIAIAANRIPPADLKVEHVEIAQSVMQQFSRPAANVTHSEKFGQVLVQNQDLYNPDLVGPATANANFDFTEQAYRDVSGGKGGGGRR